jgi:hypothetical protein
MSEYLLKQFFTHYGCARAGKALSFLWRQFCCCSEMFLWGLLDFSTIEENWCAISLDSLSQSSFY